MDKRKPSPGGSPLRGNNRAPRRVILASHLVFTGYAHWLGNDPRGSGSEEIRKDELKPLGEIQHGRKRVQPPKHEIKQFYRDAKPLLEHETIWFDDECRHVIAEAVGRAAEKLGYTLLAFSVCSNHMHAVARTHRDRSEVIWQRLAEAARDALREAGLVPADHPVWSHRIYKVFKYAPEQVAGAVDYVEDNPEKEGLPAQQWGFVKPCPYGKRKEGTACPSRELPRRASGCPRFSAGTVWEARVIGGFFSSVVDPRITARADLFCRRGRGRTR
jgi:hypothetical protein